MIERRHSRRTAPPHPAALVLRFRLLLSTFNCRLSASPSINSFPLILFTDPHLLNTVVSYRYKNDGRAGATFPHSAQSWHILAQCKPFRCNTYKKHRGVGVVLILALILNPWIVTRHAPSCLCPEALFPA